MRVNDGVNIGPHFIYQKVHRNFARRLSLALDPVALRVDDDHVLRLDESLVANRRRAHDVPVRQTHTDIAVRRGDIAFFVNKMTESRDLCSKFIFRHERHSTIS